jgi:hypothetical protein
MPQDNDAGQAMTFQVDARSNGAGTHTTRTLAGRIRRSYRIGPSRGLPRHCARQRYFGADPPMDFDPVPALRRTARFPTADNYNVAFACHDRDIAVATACLADLGTGPMRFAPGSAPPRPE